MDINMSPSSEILFKKKKIDLPRYLLVTTIVDFICFIVYIFLNYVLILLELSDVIIIIIILCFVSCSV